MRKYYLFHLGIGNVGGELVNLISKASKQIEKDLGARLIYCGLFTSSAGVFNKNGLDAENAIKELKSHPKSKINIEKAISEMPLPFILIDTTTSDNTIEYIKLALKRGGFAVLSNKRPLTGSIKDFEIVRKLGAHNLFFETVAGAGLPVMHTLKTLFDTGDEAVEIKGCFSGTLGYIFSEMDRGVLFSEAVIDAKNKGFTERDPRADLSGEDVARKALIFARLIGKRLEMEDIQLEGLYPKDMQSLSIDDFMKQLQKLDKMYEEKVRKASKEKKVLRFVAKVNNDGCNVGLEAVDEDTDIGRLKGPDNLIVIQTKRYYNNPMVIKGPGAGIEVTAAGLFGDIIHILRKKT